MRRPDEKEFGELVAGRSHELRRVAYLMCGDWHQAEDLVQTAFVKLYCAWGKVNRRDDLDAYLRKTLLHVCIDEKRRGWRRREWPTSAPPDLPDRSPVPVHDRDLLVTGLRRIAPGQRAVLVLRYWEDLDIEQTARVLGCSTGTVKSQTARGLVALRAVVADLVPADAPGPEDVAAMKGYS
ncbi:RNA polymerase sigma-70 factor (sigma-E family) [Catenulispora sp. GP43]|uniref:SigE family RNA polymerase sigma factor n=1 Tax=Catenulispora sp. GP43 TaxID=3156263 RepID=UPI003518E040